ncbi:MAG: hypothetical protein ACTTJV_01200 [Ottowia sp.]
MLKQWVYVCCYPTSRHRASELRPWKRHYNFHRPHSATKHRPPISRLGFVRNNV